MEKHSTTVCCADPSRFHGSSNIRQNIRPDGHEAAINKPIELIQESINTNEYPIPKSLSDVRIVISASQKEDLSVKSEGCCSIQSHMTSMTSEESDDQDHETKDRRVRIFLKTQLPPEISSYYSLYTTNQSDVPFLLKQSKKSTLIFNSQTENPQSKEKNNSYRTRSLDEKILNTSPALLDHNTETKTNSHNNSQEPTASNKFSLESLPAPATINMKSNEHFSASSSPDQGMKHELITHPRPPILSHDDDFSKYSHKKSILKSSSNYESTHSSFPDNSSLLQTKDNISLGIETKQVPTEENTRQEERESYLNTLKVNFSKDLGSFKTFIPPPPPPTQGFSPVPKDLPHVFTLLDSPTNLQKALKDSTEEFWYSEPSMDILHRDIIFIKPPSNTIPTKSELSAQLQEYTQINIPPMNQNFAAGYFCKNTPTSENSYSSSPNHPQSTRAYEASAGENIVNNGSTSGYINQASNNQNVVTDGSSSNQIRMRPHTPAHISKSTDEDHGVIERDQHISNTQELISERQVCSYRKEEGEEEEEEGRTSTSAVTEDGPGSKLKQRFKNIALAIRTLHRRKIKEDRKLSDFTQPDMKEEEEDEEELKAEMPICKYDNSHLSHDSNEIKQNKVSDVHVLVTNDEVKNATQKSIHIKISLAQTTSNEENPTLDLIDSLTARVEKLERQMHMVQTNQAFAQHKMKNEIPISSKEEEQSKKKLHLLKQKDGATRKLHNKVQGNPEPNKSSSVTKTEVNNSDKTQGRKLHNNAQGKPEPNESSSVTKTEINNSDKTHGRKLHNNAQEKSEPNESSSVTKTEVNNSDKTYGRKLHNNAQGKPEPQESSSVTKEEVNNSDKTQSEKTDVEKQETEGELSSTSATRWEFLKQWHGNDLGFAQQFHPRSDTPKYYIINEPSTRSHYQATVKDDQGSSVTSHSTHTDIAYQINKKWFERQLSLINTDDSGRASDHQPIIQDQKPDRESKGSLTENSCCIKMTCRCGTEESKHETGLAKETREYSDETHVMCIDNVLHLKKKSERNITWALCPEIFNVTEIPIDDKQKGARSLSRKKSSPESVKQQLSVYSDIREDLEDIKQICKDFLQSTGQRATMHSVSSSDSFTLPELSNIKTELESMRKSWEKYIHTKKNNSDPVITMNTIQQNEKSSEKDVLDVLRKRRECGIFTTSVQTMYEDNEGIPCIHSNEKELMDVIQLKRKTGVKESSFLTRALDSSQSDIWPDPSFRDSKDLLKLLNSKKPENVETSFQQVTLDSSPGSIWLDNSLGECSIDSKEDLFTSVCSKINIHSQTDNMSLVNLAMPINNRYPEVYMALSSWDDNRKQNLKSFHPLRKIKSCSNTYSHQTVSYRTSSNEQIGIKQRTIKSKVIKNIGRCVHYLRTHQLPLSRRKKKRKSRGGYMLESHMFEIKPDTEEISRYFLHNQYNPFLVAPRATSDRLRINTPKTTSRNKQKLWCYDC